MLIFIYGDDTFRVQEKVQFLRREFIKKYDPTGMNTVVFDAVGTKPNEVLQAVRSAPFMAEKRMVILRDLFVSLKKDAEDVWADVFAHTPESTVMILWETLESAVLEKKALFKKLKTQSQTFVYPLPLLEGAALERWVATRVKERCGTIAQDALRELVERVGGDLWQMDNEVGKLVAYANGQMITHDMVRDMVRASFEKQIFELVDAISRKQKKKAIELLEQERAAGSDNFYLMAMLARQVRILLGARALLDTQPRATKVDLAREMELHPFVAQKALEQARGFTFDHLKHTHDLLFAYDTAMKSGGMSAPVAVDLVTANLLL